MLPQALDEVLGQDEIIYPNTPFGIMLRRERGHGTLSLL